MRHRYARDRRSAIVAWQVGDACRLPYADEKFDRVFNSLFLHHLRPEDKVRALAEMRRVLCPEGRLVLADWGRPRTPLARAAFSAVRMLDGFGVTAGHAEGRVGAWIREAGFSHVEEVAAFDTLWGTLRLHLANPGGRLGP